MRRREFITLLGGAAAVWPLTASAQQTDRVRRLGVLMGLENGPLGQVYLTALLDGLRELGWTDGSIRSMSAGLLPMLSGRGSSQQS
jgi:putative ABC transport system substrate-binding protein